MYVWTLMIYNCEASLCLHLFLYVRHLCGSYDFSKNCNTQKQIIFIQEGANNFTDTVVLRQSIAMFLTRWNLNIFKKQRTTHRYVTCAVCPMYLLLHWWPTNTCGIFFVSFRVYSDRLWNPYVVAKKCEKLILVLRLIRNASFSCAEFP